MGTFISANLYEDYLGEKYVNRMDTFISSKYGFFYSFLFFSFLKK